MGDVMGVDSQWVFSESSEIGVRDSHCKNQI